MLVDKLGKILEARYGTGLEIKNILSLEQQVHKKSYWVGEQLHIPLRKNNTVLGTAVVTKAKKLSEEAQRNIADLVQFILEPQAYNKNLQTTIENLENDSVKKFKSNSENILNITDYQKKVETDLFEFQESEEEESYGEGLITAVIHLYSRLYTNKIKIAHALHDVTKRWIFVHYRDIRQEIRSVEDLKSMGQTTIFIPDILDLSLTEQKIIGNYLNSQPEVDQQPLMLIGSSFQFSQIIETPAIHESLKQDLLGFYFDVDTMLLSDSSMNYQKILDILELMFCREL